MARPIDFFIIGAPKAGTDAFRNWLNECPDTWVYGPAEPNYLCHDILYTHKHKAAWIKKVVRQAGSKRLVGEKSTWYLGSQSAIFEIATRFPNASIVILTRDNVSLFLSLHAEMVKLGVETELDPMVAWHKTSADPLRLKFVNTFLPNYLVSCQIGQQIERWIDQFGHDRVLIARIQDLETAEGRRRIAAFIGLRQYPDTSAPVVNRRISTTEQGAEASVSPTEAVRNFLRLVKSTVRFLTRDIGGGSTRPVLYRTGNVALPLTEPSFREELSRFFATDARRTAELEQENLKYHRGSVDLPYVGSPHNL